MTRATSIFSSQRVNDERRIFYVDVGKLSQYEAETLINRVGEQFRKIKYYLEWDNTKIE